MKNERYRLIHQISLWSAYDSDMIRIQLHELKEPYKDKDDPYRVKTIIDNLDVINSSGYNDIDSALHAIIVKYKQYLYYHKKAPF